MLSTVLNTGDPTVNKPDKTPALRIFTVWWKRRAVNTLTSEQERLGQQKVLGRPRNRMWGRGCRG